MRAKRVRDRTKLATAALKRLLKLTDDPSPALDTGFIESVYQELYARAEHACLRSDYVAAITALEASSEHLARSKVLLGTLHENGLGMPANFNRAEAVSRGSSGGRFLR